MSSRVSLRTLFLSAFISSLFTVGPAQQPYTVSIRYGVLDTTCYPSCAHPSEWLQQMFADVFDSTGALVPLSNALHYRWGTSFCNQAGLQYGAVEFDSINVIAFDGNQHKSEPGCCDECPFQTLMAAVRVRIDDQLYTSATIRIPNILVPAAFELLPNYPNPFNGSTTLTVHMKTAGDATLKVFDARGVLVATLMNAPLNAGAYHLEWKPREIASGVYYARLFVRYGRTGSFRQGVKMQYLK